MSVFVVFLVRIFPHLDLIRGDPLYFFVSNPNAGKYGPEKLRIRILFMQCYISIKIYQKTLTLYKSLTTSFWENQKEGKTLAKSSKSKSGYWTYRTMFVLVKWNINTWGTYYQSSPYLPTSLCYEYFAIPNFTFPQNVCSKSVDVYKHLKFPYEYFHKEGCYKLKVISYFNVN